MANALLLTIDLSNDGFIGWKSWYNGHSSQNNQECLQSWTNQNKNQIKIPQTKNQILIRMV